MLITRRRFGALLAACGALAGAALLPAPDARAQEFPAKPIRIILPYSVGGSADALARAIASQMQGRLGQPVIVESRPGANSMLGAELVARAPADGYTLLYLGWPTITLNPVVHPDARFKLEDFQPLTTTFRSPIGLTVKADFPANTLPEMLEYARSQGGLSFGTSGPGSSPHMLLTRLGQLAGVSFNHVPYKGEGPAVLDVMGGHLPMFAGGIATPEQHIRAGTLKVLAISHDERLPAFPDIPTFKESGFPDEVFTFWHGFALPAGTPAPIVEKLHAAIAAAMESEPVRNVLGPDQIPTVLTPEDFKALMQEDIATWTPVIRQLDLAN